MIIIIIVEGGGCVCSHCGHSGRRAFMELLLYLFIRKVETSLDLLRFNQISTYFLTEESIEVIFSLRPLHIWADTSRLLPQPALLP